MDNENTTIIGGVNTRKVHHSKLIMEGVCSACCDCGMPLTDSVSISRGIGPVCGKKGYLEDPIKTIDVTDAIVSLSPYPELIEFLMSNYSEVGNRGFMNGLVKVCSLNRQNKELVKNCCMAIEMLGWTRLANAIRNSCIIMTIKNSKNSPDYFEVYLKNVYYKPQWSSAINQIPGTKFSRNPQKHNLVLKSKKDELWAALLQVYNGECVKGPEGIFQIRE
jgi:hypothetical protein